MTTKELINFLQQQVELNPHMANSAILEGSTHSEITGIGLGHNGICLTTNFQGFIPEKSSEWDFFEKAFKVAGIEVLNYWQIPNEYWPDSYIDVSSKNPWWLVQTPIGMITIGWRKRVINIDWANTPLRTIITLDEVTKSETMVHAWSEEKMIEYLKTFGSYMPNQMLPSTFVAKSILGMTNRNQKEMQGLAEFVEKYLVK